jgi:hypothetical protein
VRFILFESHPSPFGSGKNRLFFLRREEDTTRKKEDFPHDFPLAGCIRCLRRRRRSSAENTVWLDTLDLSTMSCAWGHPQAKRSVNNNPLTLGGKTFERGVGTPRRKHFHAPYGRQRAFVRSPGGRGRRGASARCGVREVPRLYADKKLVANTGVLHAGDSVMPIRADLSGAQTVTLEVTDGGDGNANDHADWADARFVLKRRREPQNPHTPRASNSAS